MMAKAVVPVLDLITSGVDLLPAVAGDDVNGNVLYGNDGRVVLKLTSADAADEIVIVSTIPQPEGVLDDLAVIVPGQSPINLVPNPSGELTPSVISISSSSAGQPADSVVDTTAWARYGTHASRFTNTRDDGINVVARTPTGVAGVPVTPADFLAMRVSTHLVSVTGNVLDSWRARLQWYKADGTSSATTVTDGLARPTVNLDDEADLYVIAQVPADAAFVALGGLFDMPAGVATMVVDLDAFALYNLGADFTGPTGTATNEADVPEYGDGTFLDWEWSGAAHASTSYARGVQWVGPLAPLIFNQDASGTVWIWSSSDLISMQAVRL